MEKLGREHVFDKANISILAIDKFNTYGKVLKKLSSRSLPGG
jgi:hypothetical protein